MEENPELKMVKSMLRSLLLSCKEGVAAAIVQKDYRELVGEPLPFRKLGFPTLEDFILSMPDVVRISRKGSDYIFHAVADESTAHIQKLVSKQRSKKVKKPIRRPRGGGKVGAHFLARPPGMVPVPRPPGHHHPHYGPPTRGYRRGRGGMPSFMPQMQRPQIHHALSPVVVHLSSGRGRMITVGSRQPNDNFAVRPQIRHEPQIRQELPPRFRKQKQAEMPAKKSLAADLEHLDKAEQYLQQLRSYMAEKGILATFQTTPAQGGFASSILINKTLYNSAGIYGTATEAEAAAARNALLSFEVQEQDDKMPEIDWDNPTSPISNWAEEVCKKEDPSKLTTQELNRVKNRIKEILKNKKNGLWGTRIPFEYKEKYNEEAPGDLAKLLKQWPDICKVDVVANTDRDIVYPVDDSAKDLTIPTEPLLKSGVESIVYVSYMNNPGYFCVQREDSVIDEISGHLEGHCKSASPPDPRLLQKGQFCAGIFSGDGSWTRAQVLQLNEQSKAELLFIDYGNVEWVSVDSIKWLSTQLASYPAQAITCSLVGIIPLETETEWSDKASKELAAAVADEALILIPRCLYDNIMDVELYLKSDRSVSLNDRLIQKGLVRRIVEKDIESINPEELVLPDEGNWDVHVTYISSSTESVMVRIVGEDYSDRLDDFQAKLETAFKGSSSDEPILEGVTYVAYDDGLYFRVRVISQDEKKVDCYFLDHGDTDRLVPMQLQPLDPDINNQLPYQALEVRMFGLENVCTNITALNKMVDLAMGKTCVAEVVDREDIPSMILYDTSGDVDVNINETILKTVADEGGGIDSPRTASPAPNSTSSTSSTPRVLSPVPSGLTKGGDSSGVSPLSSKEDVRTGSEQQRGDASSNNQTNSLSAYLPPPPPEEQTRNNNINGNDSNLSDTMKVLSLDTGDQHTASIAGDSAVTVSREPNLNQSSETGAGAQFVDSVVTEGKEPVSRLRQFPVPEVGEYLDVHIVAVNDPHNFICMPYEEMSKLDVLLHAMLKYYTKNVELLREDDVVLGEEYAGVKQGLWVRVKVTQKVAPELYCVYQVDLGEFSVLELSELRPLDSSFCQLPIMAFHAKLGNLTPSDSHWSEASKFKLIELAQMKDLVGLIQGVDPDTGLVDLRLIDTSNENYDVCIDEVLIKLGYAQLSSS